MLNEDQKAIRMEMTGDIIWVIDKDPSLLRRIVNGDEKFKKKMKIVTCDFNLFPKLTRHLMGRQFQSTDEVKVHCKYDIHTKNRRTEEEHREFNRDWTESFAFICNSDGLPTCLICHKKLTHYKKSNLERLFTTKHTLFTRKYPADEERKKSFRRPPKTKKQSNSMLIDDAIYKQY
ncbi:general transcription factor II-I repeat domain-containing protein 2 [Trichonephila clavipes]|uniref:General transcription factor II-I repeat domain-containing protein 2 n=1 Tax=Trichonephila clavipes TaxID=2585209 RepID=A0A8X6UXW7_TRICX|nr:general transcription factor II-I repeat domain-containing protein 2 [Trichonephila clavipes]